MKIRIGRKSERGMSLIAMLVIVVLIGGIASAFFLLSLTESQQAETVRNRIKSYYLGEAAIEQVAIMVKQAAGQYSIPNNPVVVSSAPTSGTMTVNGLTSQWAFQYVATYNSVEDWWPKWDDTTGNWTSSPKPGLATSTQVAAAGTDTSKLRLYMRGTISIPIEGTMNETFTYEITNFQNIAGGGVGNTAEKNYYTIAVEGRVKNYDSARTWARAGSTAYKGSLVRIKRELELNNQSLLPFFAFYTNDLEFLPGPPFVGNGKIHTNTDLYIGGGNSMDLNTDYIGAVGQVYRHRKNNGSYTDNPGTLTIHPPIAGTPTPGQINHARDTVWSQTLESANTSGTPDPNWGTNAQAAGLSPTVMNGATGAQAMATPPVGSIQPPPASGGSGGTYYEWAKSPTGANDVSQGLILSVDSAGVITATYNGGSGPRDVTNALTTAGVIRSSQIADNRQSTSSYVNTTTVDMDLLRTSGYMPRNGILYATDARNGSSFRDANGVLQPPSSPPTVPSGFVFKNGKNLDASLSIVSNGPVYVQGDFNAPDTTTLNPATGQPYTKQPAAVIADAVNLLSNSWNNTKTLGSNAALPRASETTYNFALITGNVPTDTSIGRYSGGLENLPRFHEDWSGGVRCNYRGALINLWESAIAKGAWGQGGVYNPPNRNWDWDSSFGSSSVHVPGFPKAVTISRTIFVTDYWGAGGSGAYRSAQ